MNVYSAVYFILLFISLISFAVTFKNKVRHINIVMLLLILWFLTSVIAIYLIKEVGLKNNLFIFHISTPIEYVILSALYKEVIVSPSIKKNISISIPVFIVLSIVFALFIQKTDSNNSYMIIIESVIMVFLSLFFLREILLLQQVMVLHRFPLFWITVGLLFYFTGNLIIEGMLNYMINHSMELAQRTYRLSYIFKYLLFSLFIISSICNINSALSIKNKQ